MFFPKQTKYKKVKKGRLKGIENRSKLQFGNYGIQAKELGRLNPKQIEAARQVISKQIKQIGKVWVRVFPSIPVTSKPTGIRMGKGKGNVDYWSCKIKPGQIIFEIECRNKTLAQKSLQLGSQKLPLLTQII
jgi:large subunit ribosomal protein L16